MLFLALLLGSNIFGQDNSTRESEHQAVKNAMQNIINQYPVNYSSGDDDDLKEETYQKGREETIQQILPFFKEHPEAKENYEKWRLGQMETTYQK